MINFFLIYGTKLSIYALVLRIYKGGNFLIRENHFTKGNQDWFGENNIPSIARDVIFPKPVKVPRGKVIFPDNKITSQVNPQNECIGNFAPRSQVFHCDK